MVTPRPRTRPILPAVAGVYDEIPCKTETDVLAALNTIAARGSLTDPLACLGGRILLAAPMVFSAPVRVPERCLGLTVRAAAKFAIRARGIVDALFEVTTTLVTIRDILAYGDDDNHFAILVKNLGSSVAGFSGSKLRLLDCDLYGGQVYVDDSAGDASHALVHGCSHENVGGAHDASILFDSLDCCAEGNSKLLSGGGDVITIASNASRCRISHNRASGPIHSDASGGENTIVGNATSGGAITSHATDTVGLNT